MINLSSEQIGQYQTDGAVFLPGLFADWVERLCAGVETNMAAPGPHAAENLKPGEGGRFFDDYCNWQRIPEFQEFIRNSPALPVASKLMRSDTVQVFHDHVLVKEPGTSKPTPWHQDAPYYFVGGDKNISFWIPLDPVSEASLRLIAGSHRWKKQVLPTRWLSEQNFYPDTEDYMQVPDPDNEPGKYRILEWTMQPGDAVAFHFNTLHGARGNPTGNRRRAFSLRLVGDDATYVERPGPTSPPFTGHGMKEGDKLREDWFPILLDAKDNIESN